MSNQEILTKAIEKAIAGGWKQTLIWIHGNVKDPNEEFLNKIQVSDTYITWDYEEYISAYELIFNHDFAKALWGEKHGFNGVPVEALLRVVVPQAKTFSEGMKATESIFSMRSEPIWQYHLQQMVIADDPIQYLGEHLDA